MPLVVLENICWAFNSYEGTYQLQTVYVENAPFVNAFKMDCIGAIDTIPHAVFNVIKDEIADRLYSSSLSSGEASAAISTAPAAPAAGASRATAASAIDGEGSKRRRIAMDAAGFAEPARSTASSRKGAGKSKAQHKELATQRYEDYASDDDEADIYTPGGTSSSSSSQGGAASSSCDGEED